MESKLCFKLFFGLRMLSFLALLSLSADAQMPLFSAIESSNSGITFNNTLQETEFNNVWLYQYLYNGGGVAAGDINNDGLTDLFFTGNSTQDQLYLNLGNFQFKDITTQAGLTEPPGWSTGVTMADVNADGWLDIYICKSGKFSTHDRRNLLYINNHDNTFSEQAEKFGLNDSAFSTQAAFFDMDHDGDLDMLLLNHAVAQPRNLMLGERRNERDSFSGNKLFRNDNGVFNDVSIQAGIKGNLINFGLGLSVGDINNDGYEDIFVTNDYNEQDFLYLNNKNGTFTEILSKAFGHTANFSMGCDLADINNDGFLDLFVADMLPEKNYRQKILKGPTHYDAYDLSVEQGYFHQIMHNMLQINNGNNTFSEIAYSAGIAATDWSWAPLFADFDNDGFQDLYITNGYRRDFTNMDFLKYNYGEAEKNAAAKGEKINTLELVQLMPEFKLSNYLFRGNADLKFQNITDASALNIPSFSNGAAYADLDNDGDLDIIVNNINDKAFVFRNNAESITKNHYLRIKCIGEQQNIFATGTRINITSSTQNYTRELMPTRGFQSAVEPIIHFGLGDAEVVDVEIVFPSGKRIFLYNQPTNTTLVVEEKNGVQLTAGKHNGGALFLDVTNETLNYTNVETPNSDFKSEPLLPYKHSSNGPKMAFGDLNGDGLEDLFIAGAKGQKATCFINDNNGSYFLLPGAWNQDAAAEDTGVLIFDADNDGDNDIYVSSGSNEFEPGNKLYADRLYINNGNNSFSAAPNQIPQLFTPSTCVIGNDFDGDGDIDLFIGGGGIPGRYPLTIGSRLLLNTNGVFEDVTTSKCPELLKIGNVHDAQFVDINNDGKNDLIIVGEWMPIQVLINENNKFVNITNQAGLANTSGWWNCLRAADLDNDGDMDFVAGNIGNNLTIKPSINFPVKIYPYDFDGNGIIDPIITYYLNDTVAYPLPSRDDLLDQINSLKKSFVYYDDYASADIFHLFPKINFDTIPVLAAQQFESAAFYNNGNNTFTMQVLPQQAQWFPINDIAIYDFNADGFMDILIAGNNYNIRPELGRIDAGYGALLVGSGDNSFSVIPQQQSGLFIPGQVTNMQIISVGRDKFLFIAKNNAAMQVLLLAN